MIGIANFSVGYLNTIKDLFIGLHGLLITRVSLKINGGICG